MKTKEITEYLDRELEVEFFNDLSLNGLQVEGKDSIKKVAAAVDAGMSVIDEAIKESVDLLVVHHGIFWGKPFAISGSKKELIKKLIDSGLNLYASHIPLDANEKHGNNYSLARLLKLSKLEKTAEYSGAFIGCKGVNKAGSSLDDFVDALKTLDGAAQTNFIIMPFGPKKPEQVSIISGSGIDEIYNFEKNSFDTFITGEAKQFAYHFAKENKLNVICAGHYATETVGVKNITSHIADKFKLENIFIDQPTGI